MADEPKRLKISVVTCAYNESACIDELARQLEEVFDALPQFEFEVIAVENGSEDDTFQQLLEIQRHDARFRVVQLARNFGFDGGLTAGLALATGDASILMAADLQDPPKLIPQLIARWQEGYENVYGVVGERHGTSKLRRLNSNLFYWLIGKLADQPIPAHARDFRLLDRRVYEQLQKMNEHNRFMRGLAAWPGFRSIGVQFDQPERFAGESKASSGSMGTFAIRAILANSLAPLKVMPAVGAFLVTGSALALISLLIYWEVAGVPFPGFGTIVATSVLVFGVLALFLSIIGIYVGLIYDEVRGRPNYVIRQVLTASDASSLGREGSESRLERSEQEDSVRTSRRGSEPLDDPFASGGERLPSLEHEEK